MHLRLISLLIVALLLAITACQGPPPTQIVIVVTATPSPEGATEPVNPSITPTMAATMTPSITPTLDPFPTTTVSQVQVAEERFQHGRMFWLLPVEQIWVMVEDSNDPTRGIWTVYNDTFVDGEPESDPSLVPPDGLVQPERGFGKLWRENPDVKAAVGWALEAEFGHVTRYEYHPGGFVNDQGVYVPGPGYHILQSWFGDVFRFNETDDPNQPATWETVP